MENNIIIPAIFGISALSILIYIIKERYRDLHKRDCDCNWSDSSKSVVCNKCKK